MCRELSESFEGISESYDGVGVSVAENPRIDDTAMLSPTALYSPADQVPDKVGNQTL
jgi:hypothetical protein